MLLYTDDCFVILNNGMDIIYKAIVLPIQRRFDLPYKWYELSRWKTLQKKGRRLNNVGPLVLLNTFVRLGRTRRYNCKKPVKNGDVNFT